MNSNLTLPKQVIKRNGAYVAFDVGRIERCVKLCYAGFEGETERPSTPEFAVVDSVVNAISHRYGDTTPTVEQIQDLIEISLANFGEFLAAKRYILYREEHSKQRIIVPAEVQEAFEIDRQFFPTPLQRFMFYDKYSRFNWERGRRETWLETIDRAVDYLIKLSGGSLGHRVYDRIRTAMRAMNVMPSMRLLAMAGPAAERNSMSIYNCSHLPVRDINAFAEAMLISLAGCGVGYSVERENVEQFPRIKRQTGEHLGTHVIEDTSEGWANSVRVGMRAWFMGADIDFDSSQVRKAGTPLLTKGGRASGPEPLLFVLDFCRKKILSRQGSFLRTLDAHDMMCVTGGAAVSGGVRRTAMIAIFDYDDHEMRTCKDGAKLDANPWRWNANNSAVWPEDLDQIDLIKQFTEMYENRRGEPGIFSRANAIRTKPARRKTHRFGPNPCLPEFAPILTKNGLVPLDMINTGSTIWTETGWARVLRKWFSGHKAVHRYRTTAGVFYGTEDHRVVADGVKIKACEAESIDILAGPTWDVDLEPQDVMDGFVVGDGSIHKASNNLVFAYFGEDDSDCFDSEIKKLIVRHRPGLKDTAWEVSTTIEPYELPLTYEREIPDRFFYGSPSKMAGFLRGLYSANGSVVYNRVTLKTSSRKIAEQVQVMLSALGIRSYYTTNRKHLVEFANGTYECRESYDVNITVDRETFANTIGFIQQYKNDKIKIVTSTKAKTTFDIIEVEFVGYMDVYDILIDNKPHTFWNNGVNVSNCGEIDLAEYEFCNLSIAVARPNDTLENLIDKVEIATIIGTIQSLATEFPHMRPEWKANCEDERLLGVDISGQQDCPAVQNADTLAYLREHAVITNIAIARALGINPSAAVTCNKPNGNSSQLLNCASGIHRRWAPFYIRNVRVSPHTPIYRVLKTAGVPMDPENGQTAENATTWVIHFPVKSPEGAKTRKDYSAIDQCEYWLMNKLNWSEHNPSVTITYQPEELLALTQWVWEHRHVIGGMAFLPTDDAHYNQMPYEEITEDEYNRLMAEFPEIDFSLLFAYEQSDMTEAAQTLACAAGNCEL
jgi:ribonucleotide reductase, class II